MFTDANTSKRTDRLVKALALLVGILIGCFYASFGRSVGRQWFLSPKVSTTENPSTIQATTQKPVINETARFLVSDDTSIANFLRTSIPVLCWVHMDKLDKERIDAINKTWAARCTDFITIIKTGESSSKIFNIQPEGKNQSSNIESAYRFLYEKFGKKFDWFLKTDGKSYVVMENLRYALFAYDPLMGVGVGLQKNTTDKKDVYLSDKGGYALSGTALELLVNGFEKGSNCKNAKQKVKDETRIGVCLNEMGVHFGNSTDQHGKELFFEKNLDDFFLPEVNVKLPYPWYQDYKVNHNLDRASNYSISFYGISSHQMYVMEFLIYQLRPYGIETEHPNLPEKMLFEDGFFA